MRIDKISRKQREVMKFAVNDKRFLVCDGAIRSGKTVIMLISYLTWAMANFNETDFAICSKTIQTAERNLLKSLQSMKEFLPFDVQYSVASKLMTVKCGSKTNYFYLFGGKDERSYMMIQGMTLYGLLLDEVALMPESFVDQALARTASIPNAKIYFNCNPEHPMHWFYLKWIKPIANNKEAQHIHFLMTDNPVIGKAEIERADRMYSGIFHDRYIKGLWVATDGLIHTDFAKNPEKYLIHRGDVKDLRYINIGHDIGGHKSHHTYVATGFDRDFKNVYALQSWSLDAKDTSVSYISEHLKKFIEEIKDRYGFVDYIYVDSAEQAIINTERSEIDYPIRNSIKNEILDRIRCENYMLATEKLKIVEEDNEALIDGLKTALWDDKKFKDERRDDGTSNICILDGFEYSFEPYMRQILRS